MRHKRFMEGAAVLSLLALAGCEPSFEQLREEGYAEMHAGKLLAARGLFKAAIEKKPESPDVLYSIARIYQAFAEQSLREKNVPGVGSVCFDVDAFDDAHAEVLDRSEIDVKHRLGQARRRAEQNDVPRAGADIVDGDRRPAAGRAVELQGLHDHQLLALIGFVLEGRGHIA